MAGFFQKVISTECTGKNDPKCPKYVNKERLPAFRKRCSECGSDTREIVAADQTKVMAAAALGLLLCLGGPILASQSLRSWAMSLVTGRHTDRSGGGGAGDSSGNQPEDNRIVSLNWTLEAEQNGASRTLSPSQDFSSEGKVFRSRDAFHEGDRFRLSASTEPAKMTYIFYRSGNDVRRLAADEGGRVSAPADSKEWFKLDSHPGTEEFIVVASNGRLSKLDDSTGNPDAFAKQVDDLSGRKDVALTRVQLRHE